MNGVVKERMGEASYISLHRSSVFYEGAKIHKYKVTYIRDFMFYLGFFEGRSGCFYENETKTAISIQKTGITRYVLCPLVYNLEAANDILFRNA
jgi:hypothetical protein